MSRTVAGSSGASGSVAERASAAGAAGRQWGLGTVAGEWLGPVSSRNGPATI